MEPARIIESCLWILITSIPFLHVAIVVFSCCMKKKPNTDGKNAGQGPKKMTSSAAIDNRANMGTNGKPLSRTTITTDKAGTMSQPDKASSPARPAAASPVPSVGPNKANDDGDDGSQKKKGSDEARNQPATPNKGGQKPFGLTAGGPMPVVPASDDKKDAVSPKPTTPGNGPGEKIEPTQKSFQSSKKKKMASKERSKERSKDRSKERDQKPKPKSEKAPPQFAPEMDVDDDEETLQNVKSLEKDLEPSLQNDAK